MWREQTRDSRYPETALVRRMQRVYDEDSDSEEEVNLEGKEQKTEEDKVKTSSSSDSPFSYVHEVIIKPLLQVSSLLM